MLRLLTFLKPYRRSVALVLVLALAQSLAGLYLPRLMADIVDHGIVPGNTREILIAGSAMLVMALASTACAVASSYLSAKTGAGFGRDVRNRIFDRVARLSVHQFDQFSTASLITRTTNDTAQVQQVLIMVMTMVITAPMMAIGGVTLSLSQDTQLARVLIAVIPVLAIVFFAIMRAAVPKFQQMQVKIDRLNLVLDEGLTGVRVIRAFDRNAQQSARFDAANRDLTENAISVNRLVSMLMPVMFLMMNLTGVVIIWVGALRIEAGHIQVGAMMASLQYAVQILFSVFMVTALFVTLPRAAASAERINAVLDVVPEVQDPAQPRPAGDLRGHVEFQDVSFQYRGAEEPALSGVSFSAKPGEITAIIGGTGSGKSTLAGLIPRFYDVNAGRILVDGVDVREMRQEDLRARIGYVPQKAVLFTGTMASNIRFGRDAATDDEVRHAAAIAQAAEFIDRSPQGYAAPVSQGGTNLSGGQKQRLAIARALVKKADIYVFDDSFSALDFATDARLRAALRAHTTAATVFIVSQRIGTVMNADRIVVLDEGRVAGIGRHAELLAGCAVYREIAESQASLDPSTGSGSPRAGSRGEVVA
ncbi:MAG TPA: ABC transporter ATP-binding protein [Vicinamibacterales bacterium]|nr:ABC transporter ATP-binding protein [Vicinamibacterales bacterium]